MDSRIVPDPKRLYEFYLEVSAPTSPDAVASIVKVYPEDIDQDTKKQAPVFCYACTPERGATQHFTFVLTDGDGKYRFGFCRYPPDANTCLCFISYLPWFELFYAVLDKAAELRLEGQSDLITAMLSSMRKQEIPTPGDRLCVVPDGVDSGQVFSFVTPDTMKLPSIPESVNLTEYVTNIDPIYILHLFAAMLFERRILITSSKLSLVSACVHAAAQLLYPLNWQHIFIPIMPARLSDYCCAPMPFLVGVHSSVMQRIRKMPLDEVVILDCDANSLEISHDDLSVMPSDVVGPLKDMLKKHTSALDDTVPKAFLDAFVFMIGGYRDALRFREGEQIKFDAMAFIESRPKHVQPFLQKVLHLQQFQQFMMERLHRLNTGKGLADLFENAISDSSHDSKHYLSKYTDWIKSKSKKGLNEVSSTVIPSMKGALVTITKRTKKRIKGVKRFIDEIGQDEEEVESPVKSIGLPTLISSQPVKVEDMIAGRIQRSCTMPAETRRAPPKVVPYSKYKASRSESSASMYLPCEQPPVNQPRTVTEEALVSFTQAKTEKPTLAALAGTTDSAGDGPEEGQDLLDLSLPPVVATSRTRTLSLAREMFINFDEVMDDKTDDGKLGQATEDSLSMEFDPLHRSSAVQSAGSSSTSLPFEATPLERDQQQANVWADFDSVNAKAALNGSVSQQPTLKTAAYSTSSLPLSDPSVVRRTPFDDLPGHDKVAEPATQLIDDPFAVDLSSGPKRGPPIVPYRPKAAASNNASDKNGRTAAPRQSNPSTCDSSATLLQFDPLLN